MSTIAGLASVVPPGSSPAAREVTVAVIAGQKELGDRVCEALAGDGLSVTEGGAPDVIVVTCEAPERRTVLEPFARRFPSAAIVVVTPRATRQTVGKIVEAGAAGLVVEEALERSLALVVRAAFAGQLSVPLELSVGLAKPLLSNREKQILGMVVMGFRNGEIAGRLFLAESTVKSHLSSIFSKLGVRSRKEAAALVLDPDTGLGAGILTISDRSEEEQGERLGPRWESR